LLNKARGNVASALPPEFSTIRTPGIQFPAASFRESEFRRAQRCDGRPLPYRV